MAQSEANSLFRRPASSAPTQTKSNPFPTALVLVLFHREEDSSPYIHRNAYDNGAICVLRRSAHLILPCRGHLPTCRIKSLSKSFYPEMAGLYGAQGLPVTEITVKTNSVARRLATVISGAEENDELYRPSKSNGQPRYRQK